MKIKYLFVFLLLMICISSITVSAGQIRITINGDTIESTDNGDQIESNADAEETESTDGSSQDQDVQEINIRTSQRSFKANGGPKLAWMNLDLSSINKNLPDGFTKLPEIIFLKGGGGIFGFSQGNRFGWYNLHGSLSSSASGGKKVHMDLHYGGLLYEHGIYNQDKVDIAIGSLIGRGSVELDLTYSNEYNMGNPNRNIYNKSFFVIEPLINFHYKLANFIGLDLSLSYMLALDYGDNKYNDYYFDSLNISSPIASLRFSFGF
ncbi:hypothetical protein [Natronospora cellulosivora (SeqCode)]